MTSVIVFATPKYQRGGRGGVRTWLAILLMVVGLSSAILNVWQYKHRVTIQFVQFDASPCPTEPPDSVVEDGPSSNSQTL